MIFYELAILGGFFILAIVAIAACGRPMAEAYSEKIKASYAEVNPDTVRQLMQKTERLEAEIIDLRQSLKALEEACDFASGLVEAKESNDKGQVLKTRSHSKESTGI